jgi:DTW domain-containing protein YfiP
VLHIDAGSGRPTCYRCHRPEVGCICADVPAVEHRTRVLILQHPRERHHPLGTARIARLGLRRAELAVGRYDDAGIVDFAVERSPRAALLFPGPGATDLTELAEDDRPDPLVVVDGTWPNARRIVRLNPWLSALPRVALSPERPGNYRIRRARRPDVQLSTIEAIVAALRVLEPDNDGPPKLLDAFDRMIDRQIELAGGELCPRYLP